MTRRIAGRLKITRVGMPNGVPPSGLGAPGIRPGARRPTVEVTVTSIGSGGWPSADCRSTLSATRVAGLRLGDFLRERLEVRHRHACDLRDHVAGHQARLFGRRAGLHVAHLGAAGHRLAPAMPSRAPPRTSTIAFGIALRRSVLGGLGNLRAVELDALHMLERQHQERRVVADRRRVEAHRRRAPHGADVDQALAAALPLRADDDLQVGCGPTNTGICRSYSTRPPSSTICSIAARSRTSASRSAAIAASAGRLVKRCEPFERPEAQARSSDRDQCSRMLTARVELSSDPPAAARPTASRAA